MPRVAWLCEGWKNGWYLRVPGCVWGGLVPKDSCLCQGWVSGWCPILPVYAWGVGVDGAQVYLAVPRLGEWLIPRHASLCLEWDTN